MEIVEDIASLLTAGDKTLREALAQLGDAGRGYLLVVADDGVLQGVVSDGDFRRFLLAGERSLDDATVDHIMTRAFRSLPEDANQVVIDEAIDRYRFVPIIDAGGVPISVVSMVFRRLPVMEPELGGNEEAYLLECIRTGWVSSQGRFVNEFEAAFAEVHQGRPCLTTSNGTTALHLALETFGIGEGDEVIVPTLTFAATANAVIHARATPVLVDVDPDTWTIDIAAAAAAISPRTKAILPVHLYGHPARMDQLMDLAQEHDLFVIEDCAEALGAKAGEQSVGTFGDAACFSFFGNKIITTGEGGMIAFTDAADRERAAMLRDHGMSPERRYWHEEVGFNYRMTNLQAALGLAQIEKLDEILDRRSELAANYSRQLSAVPGLTRPPQASWAEPVCWLYTVLIDPAVVGRDEFIARLGEAQIDSRPMFYPLHQMPAFAGERARHEAAPHAERLAERGVSLPSSLALSSRESRRVVAAVRAVMGAPEDSLVA